MPENSPLHASSRSGERQPVDKPAESLWETVKADFSTASGLRVAGVVLLVAWMGFQWGFGNDALLPSIAASAFDAVDDGESWSSGFAAVTAAAAAGFLFWAATQAFDAVLMLSGLRLVPRITDRLAAYLRRKGWVTPYADMKWSTRWAIAYFTGASVVCLVDLFATGESGIRQRRGMIISSTLLSAGSVGGVVALVTGAAMIAKRVPATEPAADVFIRFAKNPLTWIVIFGSIFLIGHLRGSDSEEATAGAE